jgi:hypothetical protein
MLLRFKSYIRSLVEVPRRGGQCRLTQAALDHLEAACPAVVTTLPGYAPKSRMRRGPFAYRPDQVRATHDPKVERLIDKTVFSKFRFVRPT